MPSVSSQAVPAMERRFKVVLDVEVGGAGV